VAKVVSVRFEIVQICKIGAWLAPNILEARKSFWMHSMELPGDEGHVGSHFGLFGDSVSVGARLVHSLRKNILLALKSFRTHPMVS
jgi:hypothetical protein